jgi:hypothetical protein
MRTCAWSGCDAPEAHHRLCETHLYPWPFERYIHGAEPTGRRTRADGYVEIEIDGLWAVEHRMIMARELKRQLLHSEVIIHLDGNRANNDRDNLRLTDKSGAMQYRRDNPRSREPSKREFIVRMEFVVKTSGDAFIGDVADTIETAFDNNEFVGYLSDDDTFVIAAARVQTVRAVIKS